MQMKKANIAQFFRRLGLLGIADLMQFRLQQWQRSAQNRAFRKKYPGVNLPPDYTLFETFQLDYHKYYEGGRDTAQWLLKQLHPHLDGLNSGRILDWGCGPARIIRHLPDLLGSAWEFFGTDYNLNTIQWCRQNIQRVDFFHNEVAPPLPFASNFFDVIYGISIFTHLSESNHQAWYQELIRVTKPGGVLLLTAQGNSFQVRLTEDEKTLFKKGELVVRANVKEGHRLYSAFHPPAYMKQLFAKEAKILNHQPGQPKDWGIEQDIWILKKKNILAADY